ncbi:PD-(D/E)XK nuclease family protein [Bacillus luti]|uniref:PD-(D/E)XK nuclease family protein n=1 Tax=Bacillus cereus group TaxID=86661 RepID=UPI003879D55B
MISKEKIELLQKNIIFQLSLSSIELFHSNLLYWLFKHYPAFTKELLCKWLNKNPEYVEFSSTDIYREKENSKDITFHIIEHGIPKTIYLENKVKSVPDEHQLIKYSKEKHKTEGILLSIIHPRFMKKQKTYTTVTWTFIHYSELAKELLLFSTKIKDGNSYHYNLMADYIELINFLCELPFEINLETDLYDWYENDVFPIVKELRVYDLYVKGKMNILSNIISSSLAEEFPDYTFIHSSNWTVGKPGEIYIAESFRNGSSLIDIKCILCPGKCVGAQLQSNDFRLFIETTKPSETLKLANLYLNTKQWFHLDGKDCTHPKSQSQKPFNKFNNDKKETVFLYRSFKLNTPSIILIKENFIQTVIQFEELLKTQEKTGI